MAPPQKTSYFVRLAGSPQAEPAVYVPIVRDPKPFVTDANGMLTAFPTGPCLGDHEVLMGTFLEDGRAATVSDLRAGRANEMYWEISKGAAKAFWKTKTAAVRWPEGTPETFTDTFAFKHVVQTYAFKHTETRKDLMMITDPHPVVALHSRKFRETVNKISDKPIANKIDLKRTDDPVDFSGLATWVGHPSS